MINVGADVKIRRQDVYFESYNRSRSFISLEKLLGLLLIRHFREWGRHVFCGLALCVEKDVGFSKGFDF